MTEQSVTIAITEAITWTATFTVAELAELTGESVQDITTNITNRTLPEWAGDYLPTAQPELRDRTQATTRTLDYMAWRAR